MEELELLFKRMRPIDLTVLRRDKKIQNFVQEPIPLKAFFINDKLDLNYYFEIEDLTNDAISKFIRTISNSLKPEFIISYINLLTNSFRQEFELFKENFIKDKVSAEFGHQSLENFKGNSPFPYTLEGEKYISLGRIFYSELDDYYKSVFMNYFNFHTDIINKILNNIEEISSPENKSFNKIKFNLSVSEIALFFRLLNDNKTIEVENKEELFRCLNAFFQSSNTDNISPNSLRKKYHDSEQKSINEIDILLVNLRQLLKKNIKNNQH